jgi:hypothetical protein
VRRNIACAGSAERQPRLRNRRATHAGGPGRIDLGLGLLEARHLYWIGEAEQGQATLFPGVTWTIRRPLVSALSRPTRFASSRRHKREREQKRRHSLGACVSEFVRIMDGMPPTTNSLC